MKNTYGLFAAALLLLLSACAGVKAPPSATPPAGEESIVELQEGEPQELPEAEPETGLLEPSAEEMPASPEDEAALAEEEIAPPLAEEPLPPMSLNRAVIALLDQAQTSNAAGKYASAGASLERAMRIEPRNPWLWLQLAQVRLAEGQYAQAISLARKSNSLAKGQPRVQVENWQVIGKANVSLGNTASAEKAFSQSDELRQQIVPAPQPAAEQDEPEDELPVAEPDPVE